VVAGMYACIHIPDFPVQAVVRGEPELRHAAVAVVDGVPPLLTVVSLNPKAHQVGAEPGMTAVQEAQLSTSRATSLAPVAIRRRSPALERAAHAALLDLGWSFSPCVEDTATDTIILDLRGLQHLFPSPENITQGLTRRASELGLEAHIAVAVHPDAARCAARGFPGITLIRSGEEADRLGLLPVGVLAPSSEILETLDRWGVRTLRALAALPTGPLSERLGQEGVRLQKLASGTSRRSLVLARAALHFEEEMEIEHPVALLEPLSFILGRLLTQLCARLAARGLAASELHLKLELETGRRLASTAVTQSLIEDPEPRIPNPESRWLRLAVPIRDPKVLLRLVQLNLQADPPPAPVVKVVVSAAPAKPRAVQGGLFLALSPDPEKLEVTVARLLGLVGEGNVGSPELVDTHRSGAFRMREFVGQGLSVRSQETRGRNSKFETGNEKRETESWRSEIRSSRLGTYPFGICNLKSEIEESPTPNPQSRALMALRIFRPPLPATVEVRDGCPVRLSSSCGVCGDVVAVAGPWRTSGDWWATEAWDHDEWDVEIRCVVRGSWFAAKDRRRLSSEPMLPARGQRAMNGGQPTGLYRIYQDLTSGSWFIGGMYD